MLMKTFLDLSFFSSLVPSKEIACSMRFRPRARAGLIVEVVTMSERTCTLLYFYSPFAFTCHVDGFTSIGWFFSSCKRKIHTMRHLSLLFERKLYTQFHSSSLGAFWNIDVSAYKYVVMQLVDILEDRWPKLRFGYVL